MKQILTILILLSVVVVIGLVVPDVNFPSENQPGQLRSLKLEPIKVQEPKLDLQEPIKLELPQSVFTEEIKQKEPYAVIPRQIIKKRQIIAPREATVKEEEILSLITKEKESVAYLTQSLTRLNEEYSRTSPWRVFKKMMLWDSLLETTKRRKEGLKKLAREDANLFLQNVLSEDEISKLPISLLAFVEQEAILKGKLRTLHIDDFENKKPKFVYFIRSDGQEYEFYPFWHLGFLPQSEVEIQGYKIDNTFVGFPKSIVPKRRQQKEPVSEEAAKGIQPTLPTIPHVPTQYKMAVIMIDFLDSASPSFNASQAQSLIFNNQFQIFFQEQSYGRTSFSGDIFGWITLPRNTADSGCSPWLGGELESIVSNQNIDLNNYDILLMLSNGVNCGGGVAFIGPIDIFVDGISYNIRVAWILGDEGSPYSYFLNQSQWSTQYPPSFSWTNLDFLLTHEIGHAIGLLHANGYDCDLVSLGANCVHREYHNYFDAMGTGRGFSFHFNAVEKDILDWFTPQETLTIKESGIYTIGVMEDAGANKKFAKICILTPTSSIPALLEKKAILTESGICPFYLEYRKAVGFDSTLGHPDLLSNQQGLLINKRYFNYVPPDFSRLLDMNPTSLSWDQDLLSASLLGGVFYDPRTEVTIGPVLSSTQSDITFEVEIEDLSCTRGVPGIEIRPLYFEPAAGSQFGFSFRLTNMDYLACAPADFEVSVSFPAGFSVIPGSLQIHTLYQILPDEERWSGFMIEISQNVSTGSYPISVTVLNLLSGISATESFAVNVQGIVQPWELLLEL